MRDIVLTEDNDISLVKGDFSYQESTQQHQYDILQSSQGDYKTSPLSGCNLMDYLHSDDVGAMLRKVSGQMNYDGMSVNSIRYDQVLIIDASYEESNSSR